MKRLSDYVGRSFYLSLRETLCHAGSVLYFLECVDDGETFTINSTDGLKFSKKGCAYEIMANGSIYTFAADQTDSKRYILIGVDSCASNTDSEDQNVSASFTSVEEIDNEIEKLKKLRDRFAFYNSVRSIQAAMMTDEPMWIHFKDREEDFRIVNGMRPYLYSAIEDYIRGLDEWMN